MVLLGASASGGARGSPRRPLVLRLERTRTPRAPRGTSLGGVHVNPLPQTADGLAQRARVLVVDDEPGVRLTTAALLADDFDVRTAANAAQALELLAREPADIVCSDFSMPGMNGVELLRTIVARDLAVEGVLLLGLEPASDPDERRAREPFRALLKPYRPQQLLDLLAQLAARIPPRRASHPPAPARPSRSQLRLLAAGEQPVAERPAATAGLKR
jgi:DNA-binding NtrC family response regulator